MKSESRVYFAIFFVLSMIILGTFVYHTLERWNYLDSMYFATTTVATVGFGDFHPATSAGKLFTIFYVIFGVGAAVYTLGLLAERYIEKKSSNFHENMKKTVENISRFRDDSKDRLEKIAESREHFVKLRDRLTPKKDEYIRK